MCFMSFHELSVLWESSPQKKTHWWNSYHPRSLLLDHLQKAQHRPGTHNTRELSCLRKCEAPRLQANGLSLRFVSSVWTWYEHDVMLIWHCFILDTKGLKSMTVTIQKRGKPNNKLTFSVPQLQTVISFPQLQTVTLRLGLSLSHSMINQRRWCPIDH